MARLEANGTELIRIEREYQTPNADADGDGGEMIYRTVYSVRSNGHVLKKHTWSETHGYNKGIWSQGTFKRYRKLKMVYPDNFLADCAQRWADTMCANHGFTRTDRLPDTRDIRTDTVSTSF